MNQAKLWTIFFYICVSNTSLVVAQTVTEKVNQLLNEEMKAQKIPGLQLVIIRNEKIIFSEAKGYANVDFSVPVTDTTIFSINSIAKVFTGTAIMQLVDEGKINLDNAVEIILTVCPLVGDRLLLNNYWGTFQVFQISRMILPAD